jgi:hypothetical protein
MRSLAACLLAAGVLPLLVGAGKPVPFSLLLTGQYHADEVPDTAAGQWLGVYESARGNEVKPTRVRIARVPDPIVGDESGKEIVATPSKGLVFLVRGFSGVSPGPVEATFSAKAPEEQKPIDDHQLPLVLAGTRYELSARSRQHRSKVEDEWSCEVVLVRTRDGSPAVRQTLYMGVGSCGPESTYPVLIWAGDLDQDRQLDLLVDLQGYNTSAPTLYLSSPAKSGELVAKIAQLVSVGC